MGYGVPDSGVDFCYVTVYEAHQLMKNDKAVFVDSRDDDDFKTTRIQTSFHLSANSLIMKAGGAEKGLVQQLVDLVNSGKTLVCLSDACVKGNINRGHVSRCRHIAQYLVEMGADRGRIVRMTGGINAWKKAQLDGILGDLRPMYAGAIQAADFEPPKEGREEEEGDEVRPLRGEARALGNGGYAAVAPELAPGLQVEIQGLVSRADLNGKQAKIKEFVASSERWEVELLDETQERVRCKATCLKASGSTPPAAPAAPLEEFVEVGCGGTPGDGGARDTCKVRFVPPRPFSQDRPTAYRALKTDLYKKSTKESDKIIKVTRPVGSTVRTTGELFVGGAGGVWAELDVMAGEKKGCSERGLST
ncbi:unnamed protein product [Symbiodinium natans]|uniref:Rhodanese domain-containing protein n=1 Tax=Symbiodinium natans TaxID=878477 RepID=A0A812MRQ4_9DINO|nr:unnamed protein product [Symbiodinium natans]